MDIRKEILATASEMFLKYGLRSVTIDDICKELHISKKTFYSIFRQKDELIEYLLTDIRDKRKSSFVLKESDNVIDRLLEDVSIFKSFHEKKHINFFYDLNKYYPDIHNHHLAEIDRIAFEFTIKILNQGISSGYFRDDLDVEMMGKFISMSNKNFVLLYRESKCTMGQIADFLVDSFIRLVVNEKGLAYYFNKKQGK